MMQNKMKELDLKERSSKSLLANVLDMDDDFRYNFHSFKKVSFAYCLIFAFTYVSDVSLSNIGPILQIPKEIPNDLRFLGPLPLCHIRLTSILTIPRIRILHR